MKRRAPTVRDIRAILRKAGVPLSEVKSEKKYGPRHLTEGADSKFGADFATRRDAMRAAEHIARRR